MKNKTITLNISAATDEELKIIEKALVVYAKTFTPKEHDKLRLTLQYDNVLLGQLKTRLNS